MIEVFLNVCKSCGRGMALKRLVRNILGIAIGQLEDERV
jgi:hypothetical protein